MVNKGAENKIIQNISLWSIALTQVIMAHKWVQVWKIDPLYFLYPRKHTNFLTFVLYIQPVLWLKLWQTEGTMGGSSKYFLWGFNSKIQLCLDTMLKK